jgi:hypothetical protein
MDVKNENGRCPGKIRRQRPFYLSDGGVWVSGRGQLLFQGNAKNVCQPGLQGRHGQDDQGVSASGFAGRKITALGAEQGMGNLAFFKHDNPAGANDLSVFQKTGKTLIDDGWQEGVDNAIGHNRLLVWVDGLEMETEETQLAPGFQ